MIDLMDKFITKGVAKLRVTEKKKKEIKKKTSKMRFSK